MIYIYIYRERERERMSSNNNKIAYFYDPDVGNFHYGMLNAIELLF